MNGRFVLNCTKYFQLPARSVSLCRRPKFNLGAGLSEGITVGSPSIFQVTGVAVTALWSEVASSVLVKIAGLFGGSRASEEEMIEGLDFSAHGEKGYNLKRIGVRRAGGDFSFDVTRNGNVRSEPTASRRRRTAPTGKMMQ